MLFQLFVPGNSDSHKHTSHHTHNPHREVNNYPVTHIAYIGALSLLTLCKQTMAILTEVKRISVVLQVFTNMVYVDEQLLYRLDLLRVVKKGSYKGVLTCKVSRRGAFVLDDDHLFGSACGVGVLSHDNLIFVPNLG